MTVDQRFATTRCRVHLLRDAWRGARGYDTCGHPLCTDCGGTAERGPFVARRRDTALAVAILATWVAAVIAVAATPRPFVTVGALCALAGWLAWVLLWKLQSPKPPGGTGP